MNDNDMYELYGSMVFNDNVMRKHLPHGVYKSLKETIELGQPLDVQIAEPVANAMKDWATAKGATHFTHWFQPLSEVTAEKHEAFIAPTADGGIILEFSGRELTKGEPDASAFPSGGLRATFEARGYTAWDCTSPAFIKDNTLYIPTIFCSYTGEALDKKTPLLRSMQAINKQALRILKYFGDTSTKKVTPSVGAEQEYFLVDRALYEKRLDLLMCGRTLIGAKSPKGQILNDHYYGRLRIRVSAFMKELDEELWKLGIPSKIKHNEAAPAQHEIVAVFTTANIACDHNNLMMEVMKKVAKKHDLACLFHEKPFRGVNGSGKHNNWSLTTDTGKNLLAPGTMPHDNMQFILIVCAIIKAIDEYADLLRCSVSSAANDERLGTHEAPPNIMSVFLGEELTEILLAIEEERAAKAIGNGSGTLKLGITSLPALPKDMTDRNRTSPFAFTGNKFEFRMCGSSASIAHPLLVLNAIVAEQFRIIADKLDKLPDNISSEEKTQEINNVINEIIKNHKRVIFNGNNYSEEWYETAKRLGLENPGNSLDSFDAMICPDVIEMFGRHGIMNKSECYSQREVIYDTYIKTLQIEADTLQIIINRQILPSILEYISELSAAAINLAALDIDNSLQKNLIKTIQTQAAKLKELMVQLEENAAKIETVDKLQERARKYRHIIIPLFENIRDICDSLETIMPEKKWVLPTYADLMFRL